MRTPLAVALVASLAAACGSDPVSYSQPVGISLPVASNDVVAGEVTADKDINTESGNPYSAFVNAARQRLGGKEPSRIAVTTVSLELLTAGSTVATLQEVFSGPVAISFEMNGTNTQVPVAQVTAPTGVGPVTLTTAFDSRTMAPADYAALVQGQFKVRIAGTAVAGFAAGGQDANLEAKFGFVAYE